MIDPVKGSSVGQDLETTSIGGPFRQGDGKEVFLVLTGGHVEAPGERLIVFFAKFRDGTYGNVAALARLKVGSDGAIVDNTNAAHLGVSGVSAAAWLGALKAQLSSAR